MTLQFSLGYFLQNKPLTSIGWRNEQVNKREGRTTFEQKKVSVDLEALLKVWGSCKSLRAPGHRAGNECGMKKGDLMGTRVLLPLGRRVVMDGRPWCVKIHTSLRSKCMHAYVHQQIIIWLYISWPYLIILSNVTLYQVPIKKESLLR